ncbi:MAG: DUF2058 family protein [Steroidobacteraceae bacterium]
MVEFNYEFIITARPIVAGRARQRGTGQERRASGRHSASNIRVKSEQPRAQRNGPSPQEIAAKKQAEVKAARDQELNRKQQEKAQRKALYAQIRELVSQNRITRPRRRGNLQLHRRRQSTPHPR